MGVYNRTPLFINPIKKRKGVIYGLLLFTSINIDCHGL